MAVLTTALVTSALILLATAQVIVRKNDLDIRGFSFVSPTVAYCITADNTLWRSGDEGVSWQDQTSAMPSSATSRPTAIYPTADPTKLFFVSNGGIAWRTKDTGATYELVNNMPKFLSLQFHPQMSDWALAMKKLADHNELWVTQDFGTSWRLVTTYVRTFSWGNAGSMNVPATRVYASYAAQKSGMQSSQSEFDLYYSDDFFEKSTTKLFVGGYWFTYSEPFFFSYVKNVSNPEISLYVSSDDMMTWNKAQFPFKSALREGKFSIMDTSSGAVWLTVDPPAPGVQFTNLYQSDSRGYKFVLTLSNLRHQAGIHDLSDVSGIEGIYLANAITNPDEPIQFQQIKTYITFDNGGGSSTWRKLIPPSKDSDGNDIICQGECSLHLHGNSDYFIGDYGPFYTTYNAIGLIMATGNTGLSLSDRAINTYFSRDAGLTWYEIRKGSSIYEFGDHGGIMVLADIAGPTSDIMYSLDEGLTWQTQQFAERPLNVENIIIEPSSIGRKFILYGVRDGKRTLYSLDFSGLHEAECTDADYEGWAPFDGLGRHCLLGKETVYLRRKRDAPCFNPQTKERINASNPCTCEERDWECDFDFEREVEGGPCRPVGDGPSTAPPTPCVNTYPVTNGYRKVAGDGCVNGVDHGPSSFTCPSSEGSSSKAGWIALIIVLIVFAIAIAGIAVMRNERLRNKLSFIKLPASWSISKLPGYSLLNQRPQSLADEEFGLPDDDNEDDNREISDHDITSVTSQPPSSIFVNNDPQPRGLPTEMVPKLNPPPSTDFNPRGGASAAATTTTTTDTPAPAPSIDNTNTLTLL